MATVLGGKGGRVEVAVVLVAEILDARDWDEVEAQILGRYADADLELALRLLGGPASVGEPRPELVARLRDQYRRRASEGRGRAAPASNREPAIDR